MGEFTDNIQRLRDETPDHMVMGVTVDQVYAHYQHEHPEFHHPDGGQAFYLRDPLLGKARQYLARVAHDCITPKGLGIRQAMTANAEDLSLEVYHRAPWEFGDLRASGHPWVTADGVLVYDRKPLCPRLSDEDLRVKSHLRYLFDPHRYSKRGP